MSCENNVCGTGDWNGPKPGDPDNDITLTARTVYGGVLVTWSYPLINGHAVAYTEMFRGVTNEPAAAVMMEKCGGNTYLDRPNPDVATEYYYWVEVVSIHGTRGARVGPVMGVAQPLRKQTLETLTGMIDASLLSETLKEDIAGIYLNGKALADEIKYRMEGNLVLQEALAAVQGEMGQALTYVLAETEARSDADGAIVQQLNIISAGLNENKAAIAEERVVRVTKEEALAKQVTALAAETSSNTAGINSEKLARTTADEAMAGSITQLYAASNSNSSAISNEQTARANAVYAVSNRISTVESTVNGNVATGQVGLKAEINSLNGRVSSIWYAKVQVNGLIGGFGINNDGTLVDAGFDVDRFWIGRTSNDKVKPFIIDGGVVYIDKARIRNADIDTLKIAGNSVMTGTYATGGTNSVSAYSSTTLISRTIDLGDAGNSGLIVLATIYLHGGTNDAIGFRIYVNGVVAGDQRTSMRQGYGSLFPASGFLSPGTRYATVSLEAYIPGAGSADIINSSFAIMGGKR